MNNVFTFTVEFDRYAWQSMTDEERDEWVNRVTDVINDEAYVSQVASA